MNLPNKITLSRVFLVPIFMIFVLPFPGWFTEVGAFEFLRPQMSALSRFLNLYGNYIAAAIFIVAASTDGVDGYIARKRKEVTKFGKFLDPVADKLIVTAALIALVQRGDINGWAAMIIIFRELIVTGFRLVAAGEGIVIAASKLGKLKTMLQIIAITMTLLKNFPFDRITDVKINKYAMLIAVLVTIYSGYDYIAKNYEVIDYN